MYQVGENILYGSSGVCRVAAVGTSDLPQADKGRVYYTLAPLFGTETIFVPADAQVYMRPVLTEPEARSLIAAMPAIPAGPVEEKSSKKFAQYCQEALRSHDSRTLISLLKTIHVRDEAARRRKKAPGKIEERYRRQAEDLLYGELAVALGVVREEVPGRIQAILGQTGGETA